MNNKTYDVLGIGNALVDVVARVEDSFLEEQCADGRMTKGAMALIDEARALELYGLLNGGTETSGGCAGNTLAGLGSFGGQGAFIGKVADDNLGRVFRAQLQDAGIKFDTPPLADGEATGRCMILVTLDAERTMNTFLGASVTLGKDDIDEDLIAQAKVIYLEGYLFDRDEAKAAFIKAAAIAEKVDTKVALTLSDPFCVERHREDFLHLVENHVDILFANEDEIVHLYETDSFEKAKNEIKRVCPLSALTRREKGAVIVQGENAIEIAAYPVKTVIDSTGAGDQFAAGFLYGYTQGYDLKTCGDLGALAAAEVISHIGPRPEKSLAALAESILKTRLN